MFVAADIILISIHVVLFASGLRSRLLDIQIDRSCAEFFQNLKWFWLFFLAWQLALQQREIAYGVLSLIFLVLFVDDALSLHERFGAQFAASLTFEPVAALRLQDIGELAVAAVLAFMLFIVWLGAWFHASPHARSHNAFAGIMIVAIGVFCVGLDSGGENYLPRIFGRRNFLVISRIESLPEKLPMLYFRLTR